MGSFLILFFFETTKDAVLQYIVPIWELTGTFGAFWVVASYFAYPALLIPVAQVFAGLLSVFLILIVARNSSIVFGEFIIKTGWLDERKLYQTYALSTLILGLTVLVLSSGLVSGKGVNLTAGSFSFVDWVSSLGSPLFIIGALVLSGGLAPVFFGLSSMKTKALALTAVGVGISLAADYLYSPSLVSPLIMIPTALTILAAVFFFAPGVTSRIVTNKAVFIALLCIIIFSLQPLVYPQALGGSLSIDSVTLAGPVASEFTVLTGVGAIIIGVLLVFFIFVAMRQKTLTSTDNEHGGKLKKGSAL